MKNINLEEAIYQRFIAPTERTPQRIVGAEFEFPIVNLRKEAVDFDALQDIVSAFLAHFDFSAEQKRDDNGRLYTAADPVTGDTLSFDCSFNTLELSVGKETNINAIHARFCKYYRFLQEKLHTIDHTLTGMGVNPYYRYNRYEPIANGRYRMLHHFLHSYKKYGDTYYHDVPQFNMICAASQVQLDVAKAHIIQTIRTFNRLEPLKALLFANSPFDGMPGMLISRDRFWRDSTQGYNKHNVDMYAAEPQSVDELIEYIKSESLYCRDFDGKYVHFKPIPLTQYFARESVTGEYFADGAWQEYTYQPQLSDLEYLRSFKFADLTFRGTIEYRSACEQPVGEILAHTAFHAGLVEKLDELTALLDADRVIYGHGYSPMELRALYSARQLPDLAPRHALSELLIQVLQLAEEGLRLRGMDEAHFLAPLYRRAEQLLPPAREMLNDLERGGSIETWITKFSVLDG